MKEYRKPTITVSTPKMRQSKYGLKKIPYWILASILNKKNQLLIEENDKLKRKIKSLQDKSVSAVDKEIREEELYKQIKHENSILKQRVRQLREDNANLIYKLQRYDTNSNF